jgi:hypothetical protein
MIEVARAFCVLILQKNLIPLGGNLWSFPDLVHHIWGLCPQFQPSAVGFRPSLPAFAQTRKHRNGLIWSDFAKAQLTYSL